MPEFCQYRNCHNLGVRWLDGYCNQYHMERGHLLEEKERLEQRLKEINEKLAYKKASASVPVEDSRK